MACIEILRLAAYLHVLRASSKSVTCKLQARRLFPRQQKFLSIRRKQDFLFTTEDFEVRICSLSVWTGAFSPSSFLVMPRVAFFASSSSSSLRRDNAASSAVLSRPAIIGIALGGSFVLFLALSHLFITLGRARDRRRLAVLQRQAAHAAVGSPVAALDLYESHVSSGGGARKSRLRKKSLLLFGAHSATASDADVNANSNNNGQGWPVYEPATLLPPVLPPVFSRQQSYDLYPFLPGSAPPTCHDGASTTRGRDDEFEREESQRLEKQRGRDMYQMRRRSSWIDEDALHGPRVSPKKSGKKQKKQNNEGRRKSWLMSGSLMPRRLSLKKRRPLSDPVVFGSPTLPHVGPRERERDRPMSLLALPYEMEATSPTRGNSQDSPLKPGQHNTVRIAIPSAVVSAPILPVPKPPSAMINNPRHRGGNSTSNNSSSSVAVGVLNDAAQLLAAREGSSSAAANTTNKILAPIPQRPSVPKHSATDSELSEILRMTTERLQDGKRSSRRQTMLIRSRTDGTETLTYEQHSTTTNNNDNMAMMNLTVNVGDGSGRAASPTKSQKSAPAALACAELEANEVASPGKSCSSSSQHHSEQQQQATPKRQHRHSRQMSQVSLASEADSLLTMRGTTYQPEHTTALSSPSRNNNNNVNVKQMYEPTARREDPPQQQQKARPSSAASSHASSALSTLYSEDEEATQGSSLQTRMFPLAEPGERPYNPKRGTLGQMVPYTGGSRPLPGPRGGADDLHTDPNAWLPRETSLQFTIYPMDHDDEDDDEEDDNDPFTAKAPPPDPVRLSQVFTPIPSSTFDFSGGEDIDPGWSSLGDRGGDDPLYPTVRVTKPTTPTPSPKNNNSRRLTAAALVFPPPQNLRPVISSPTLGGRQRQQRQQRQPSPAASSVYESYADSERATLDNNDNNYSTVTVPTNESAALGGGGGGGQSSVPRKMGAASYDATETRLQVDREPSGDSVYSQDQDGDLQNRPGLGLGLGLGVGLQRDSYHFPRDAADDEDDVPPLTAPNSQRTSQLLAQTVAELRRMNSSVSAASGVSSVAAAEGNNGNNGSASPTLPAMRGGGSSPGKRPAGTRNYLAVGGGSPRRAARPISQGSSGSEAGIPARTGTRSRRGTVVSGSAGGLAGPATRGTDGGRPMSGILREGSGGNLGGPEGGRTEKEKQLARLQARLAEAAGTSSESLGLYDDKGFLRSSPLARR